MNKEKTSKELDEIQYELVSIMARVVKLRDEMKEANYFGSGNAMQDALLDIHSGFIKTFELNEAYKEDIK